MDKEDVMMMMMMMMMILILILIMRRRRRKKMMKKKLTSMAIMMTRMTRTTIVMVVLVVLSNAKWFFLCRVCETLQTRRLLDNLSRRLCDRTLEAHNTATITAPKSKCCISQVW